MGNRASRHPGRPTRSGRTASAGARGRAPRSRVRTEYVSNKAWPDGPVDGLDDLRRGSDVAIDFDASARRGRGSWWCSGRQRWNISDPSVAESLEAIFFAGVAVTTVAIASARPAIDLTFPQWRVLVILGGASDGTRLSDVARQMGVTLPATSRQLRRLERRGLVTVTPNERDRRSSIARLTDDGGRARASVIDHRKALIVELTRSLESDAVTRRALARVVDALDRAPTTGPAGATNGESRRGRRRHTSTAIDRHQSPPQP